MSPKVKPLLTLSTERSEDAPGDPSKMMYETLDQCIVDFDSKICFSPRATKM